MQSIFWLAEIAWQRGDYVRAEAGMRRYEALARKLVRIDPSNARWEAELASARTNLGILLQSQDKGKQAATILRNAVAIYASLEQRSPENTDIELNTAQARAWLGDAEEKLGHFDAAYRQRTTELAVYRAHLAKDPGDSSVQRAAAVCGLALASLAIDRGHLDEALGRLRTSREVIEALVKQDPGNTFWQEISGKIQIALSEVFYGRGQLGEAEQAAGKAKSIARSLLATDPTVIHWQTDVLIPALLMQAKLAARDGQHKAALRLARSVISRLANIPESKHHSEAVWSLRIRAGLLEGAQLYTLGREGSAAAWSAAVSVVHKNVGSTTTITPATLTAIADAYQRLGKNNEARRLVSRLDAMGYRAPEYLSLKKRLARIRTEQAHRGGSHSNP